MKRYSQRHGHSAMAELNVTPLLDLAFVLLIIFIITTPLMENQVPIDLARADSQGPPPPDPKSIRTVSIDAQGQLYLEAKPVEMSALEQELSAFRVAHPEAAVIIRADKAIRFEVVSEVINTLQRVHIVRMNIDQRAP